MSNGLFIGRDGDEAQCNALRSLNGHLHRIEARSLAGCRWGTAQLVLAPPVVAAKGLRSMNIALKQDERVRRLRLRERTLLAKRASAQRHGATDEAETLAWLLRLVRAAQARLERAA